MQASLEQLKRLLDAHPTPPTTTANTPRMTMEHLRKALSLPAGYRAEKRELRQRTAAKTKPTTPTKTPRQARFEALAKALTAPRRQKPMTGDDLLTAGERLLKSGKIDPATAQHLTTAVHLGRLDEAADHLRNACK